MFRIVLLLFAGIGAGYLLRNWSFVARLERGVSLTVWALLFVFGVTIGSNRELIVNFGRFGWQAAVIACLGVAGSFAAVFVVRRYFSGKEGAMRDSLIVFVFCSRRGARLCRCRPDVAVGSRSADDYSFGDGGAGRLGTRGRRQSALYAAHVQLADAPVAALYDRRHPALSALGVLVLRGFSLTDCLAVGSGFGYYSLSSVLIADLKSATLGVQGAAELATVALLANVVREMIALFGMPLFARWGGPLAPISVAGVTSMDVCLPSIARYSGSDLVPLAILHGIVLEVCVPILVGAFC